MIEISIVDGAATSVAAIIALSQTKLRDRQAMAISTTDRIRRMSRGQWILVIAVAVAGIAVLVVGLILLVGADYKQASDLATNGTTTSAIVLRLDPKDHNFVEYRYAAASHEYVGSGPADGPDGVASHLVVGQSIHIVYSRAHPDLSCDCVPAERIASARNGLILSPLVIVAWVFGVMLWTLSGGGWQMEWMSGAGVRWTRKGQGGRAKS